MDRAPYLDHRVVDASGRRLSHYGLSLPESSEAFVVRRRWTLRRSTTTLRNLQPVPSCIIRSAGPRRNGPSADMSSAYIFALASDSNRETPADKVTGDKFAFR